MSSQNMFLDLREKKGKGNFPYAVPWQDSLARPVTARNSARPFAKKLLVAGLYGCLAWSSVAVAQTATPIYLFAGPAEGNPIVDNISSSNSNLNLTGGANFTLAACVYQTQRNAGTASVIMAKRRKDFGWMLGLEGASGNAGGTGEVKFRTQGTSGGVLVSNTQLNPDTWYHVAVVYSGGHATIYIDAEAHGGPTKMTVTAPPEAVDFRVGHETADYLIEAGTPHRWHGTLKDVRVYNVALDTAALKTLSVPCKPPATTPATTPATIPSQPSTVPLSGFPISTGPGDPVNPVELSNRNDLNLIGTNFTLAACVNQTQRNAGYASVIMANRRQYKGWMLGLEGISGSAGDTGEVKFRTQGTSGDVLVSSTKLNLNTWYHVAVAYSGDKATIYINGALDNTGTMASPQAPDTPVPFRVGHETADVLIDAGHPQRWHGTLKDVRVYNTALESAVLKTLSDSCNPPPPPPMPNADCRRIIGGQIDEDGTVTDEGVISGLLACYPLSADTRDWHDITPGAIRHDGIPKGTERHETYGDPQGTNARQAMFFDGNTFVEIPMHPEFMFKSGKPFSFALWAVFDNSLHYNPLLKLSDTDGAPQAGLAKRPYFDHQGRILARLATASRQTNVFSEDRGRDLLKEEVNDGQWEHRKEWIHLAGVFAEGRLRLYVDGWPQTQPPGENDWKLLPPSFDFANGTDMKLRIGANASLVSPTRHKGYISSVLIYNRELTDDEVFDLSGATDAVDGEPFANDPCVHEATVTSVANPIGNWESANAWNPPRPGGPGANDWVLITEGQTIIMPAEVKTFDDRRNVMGLCIERGATLQSSFGGSVALAPQFFHNKGKIRAQDDFPKGGRVFISSPEWFVNNGRIVSGSGSQPGARGGRIKINANFIRNWGRIQGGGGFYGFCGPNGAKVVPQRGGDVTVRTNTVTTNFINLGRIIGGPGGNVPNACREVGLVPGAGGWVVANAGKQRGIIQGHGGVWVDPAELIFDNRTQISGENVFVVAGEDNSIEANDLLSGAIIAEKVLTLAVGPGGSLDLSKVANQAFQAGEEIKLFVDEGKLLLPAGKTLKDVFDAPILTQAPGKVLYFATWNTEEVVAGEPNAKVTLPLNLFNAGPAADTYTITVQDSQGWPLCTLPATVTLDSQAETDLDCELTLPETTGVNNVITVTATSDNDPTMQAVEDIEVYVGDLPTPPVAPANAFPYTVSGMIVNTEEQPVMGVKVQIGDQTALTDDDGYWEIPEVPEGKYPVTVTKDGYSFDVEKEIEVGNSDMTLEILAHSLLALKVQSPTLVEQGADINYQLTVTNQGQVTTTGVTLTLELSPDVTILTLTGASGVSCNLETLVCNFPSLSPAASATVTLVVNNTGSDTLEHKAVLSSNTYPSETRIIETKVRPDLWVSTKCQPNPVPIQGQLQCVVTVQLNDKAEETATGIKLSLPKPMGVLIQSVETAVGNKCDTSNPSTISCTLADLTKGTASTVTINMQLQDGGMLMVRQQAITNANNYPSDAGSGNVMIDIPENIKADVLILLDTTGSMQMELDSTIAAVKEMMAKLPTSQPLIMALVEFKDDVRVKAFTQDPKILIQVLEGLTVAGGGMCPEASAEALEIALKHVKDGGTILLATDASPYPEADLTKLGDLLKQKNVKFHALISGDCAMSGGVNEGTDSSGADTANSDSTETGSETPNTDSSGAETSGGETSTSSGNAETGNSGGTETGSSN